MTRPIYICICLNILFDWGELVVWYNIRNKEGVYFAMDFLNTLNYFYGCGKVMVENAFFPKHSYSLPSVCTSLSNLLEIEKRTCEELCAKHPHIQYTIENHTAKVYEVLEDKTVAMELGVYALRFFPSEHLSPQESAKHILLLHGINSGPLYCIQAVPYLVQCGYDVCCLCIPTFGGSRGSKYLYDLNCQQMMDVWVEYLRQSIALFFGDDKPHLFGHSYGAHISICFAKKYSHMIDKIFLNNAFGLFPLLGKYGYYLGVAMQMEYPSVIMKQLGRWYNAFMFYCVDASFPLINKQFWDCSVGACHELRGSELFNKHIEVANYQARVKNHSICDLLSIERNELIFIWSDDDFITPTHNGLMAYFIYCFFRGCDNTRYYLLRGGEHNPVYLNAGKNLCAVLKHCLGDDGAGEAGATDAIYVYNDEQSPSPPPPIRIDEIPQFCEMTAPLFSDCFGYPFIDKTAASINTMYDKLLEYLRAFSPDLDTHISIYRVDSDANITSDRIDVCDYIYES